MNIKNIPPKIRKKMSKDFLEQISMDNSSYLWLSKKEIMDDDKAKKFLQKYKDDKPLVKHFLAARIGCFLQEINITKRQLAEREKVRESLMLDSQFQNLIEEARNNLRISGNKCTDIAYDNAQDALNSLYRELWIRDEVTEENVFNKTELTSYYLGEIEIQVEKILEELCLERGWEGFIIACIASPNIAQTEIEFEEERNQSLIDVLSISDDAINISIKRGITKKEFDAIWKGTKEFLKESPAEYKLYREIRSPIKRMLADRNKGMSIGEIAKKYKYSNDDCEEVRKSSIRKKIYREKKKNS